MFILQYFSNETEAEYPNTGNLDVITVKKNSDSSDTNDVPMMRYVLDC